MKKYSLNELISQCQKDEPISKETKEWLNLVDVGNEKIENHEKEK